MAIGPIYGEPLWEMSPPLFPSSCKRVEWAATTEVVLAATLLHVIYLGHGASFFAVEHVFRENFKLLITHYSGLGNCESSKRVGLSQKTTQ